MYSCSAWSFDPLMEEAWARKRARRRRRLTSVSVALLVTLGCIAAVREFAHGGRHGRIAPSRSATPRALEFAVSLGHTQLLEQATGHGACPEGSWANPIESPAGQRIGLARFCGLAVHKVTTDDLDPSRIDETIHETDTFATGTLESRSTQVTTFAGNSSSYGVALHGRVVGGTGRFAGSTGGITGQRSRDAGPQRVSMRVTLR